METHPPKLIERLVDKLVPPSCREHVMGDWDEKFTSTADYILRVISDLPLIVASQVRRTFDASLFFSQAAVLYAAFAGAALAFGSRYRNGHSGLAIGIFVAIVLLALICRDAYTDRAEHPDYRARRDALFAIGIGLTCELLLSVFGRAGLVLPVWILIGGSAAALLMVYMLRRFLHSSRKDTPSLEEHRKAWRWNLAWLIAALILIFTLPGPGTGGSILDAAFLVLVVFNLFRRNKDGFTGTAQEYSALSISGDPYINQLKRKRDGLEFWAGTFARGGGGILLLAIIGLHLVPAIAVRIGGLPSPPSTLTGTHFWLTLLAFAALTAFWIFVRSRNLHAARAIQDELERLKDKESDQ